MYVNLLLNINILCCNEYHSLKNVNAAKQHYIGYICIHIICTRVCTF